MGIEQILTIIGTIGGVEGIVHFSKWWLSRKATARQDAATAEAAENENYRRQIEWYEKRLAERDAKIDKIYIELREEQAARLDELRARHEVELKLAEAEAKKCLKRGCGDRVPPSEY